MLPEIKEASEDLASPEITVSETAAAQVSMMMEERELEGYSLRVFVSGSGCSGLQYGMALDDQIREGDKQYAFHGIQLLVDPVSLGYMVGSTIDYVDGPQGAGFKVENPNSVAGCGCGAEEPRGGCAGCG